MSAPVDVESHVRGVTQDEVDTYREQGWVKLTGLLSSELTEDLLSHLKEVAGLPYDVLPRDHADADELIAKMKDEGLYGRFAMSRLRDDRVSEIISSRGLGEAAALLSGQRPMRLFDDAIICKFPGWTEAELALSGRASTWSGETPWHQDYGAVPWDRAGAVQFWIALAEVTPEMGSMQYLSKSHREHPLGSQHLRGDGSLKDSHPELWEKYELSAPHHLMPGDVLAHDSLTIHYAQSNRSDRMRWAHTSYRIAADTLNNGVPYPRFKEFGLEFEVWKPFDHPLFPVVAE